MNLEKAKNIGIIMGGYSNEYDISIKSGQVVYETLKDTYNCFKIYIKKDEWILKKNNNSYSIDIKIVCSEVITNKKLFPKINSLIKIEQVTNLSYSDNFYEVDIYRERCISNNHFTFISGRNEIINSSKVFSYENNFNDVLRKKSCKIFERIYIFNLRK